MGSTFKQRINIQDNMSTKVIGPAKSYGADRNNGNNGGFDKRKHASDILIPVWQKAALTVEEAAAYSNIGITKLYELTNNPACSFVLHVGTRKRLIKRKEFEKYLSQSIEI